MSDTPRTDAAKRAMSNIALIGMAANAAGFVKIVPAVFASRLERELVAERNARENAQIVMLDALKKRDQAEADRDMARAELAELRERLKPENFDDDRV